MKRLSLCVLFLGILAHAERPGVPPSGPNITDCLKWSIPYFCKNFFGTYTQMVTEATLCQSQNGGDGFSVHLQYTNYPNQPPTPYYAIFWMKCLKFEYGNIASSGTQWKSLLAGALDDLFDHNIYVSEFLDNADGNVRVYLADYETDTLYESIWSPEVALLDLQPIDPVTDPIWVETMEEHGVGFILLEIP